MVFVIRTWSRLYGVSYNIDKWVNGVPVVYVFQDIRRGGRSRDMCGNLVRDEQRRYWIWNTIRVGGYMITVGNSGGSTGDETGVRAK